MRIQSASSELRKSKTSKPNKMELPGRPKSEPVKISKSLGLIALLVLFQLDPSSSSQSRQASDVQPDRVGLRRVLALALPNGSTGGDLEQLGQPKKPLGGPKNVWSQPDPRKSYSTPVNFIKVATRRASEPIGRALAAAKLTQLPTREGVAASPSQADSNSSIQDIESNVLMPTTAAAGPTTRMAAENRRREQVQQQVQATTTVGDMIAFIKYVPVLMQLQRAPSELLAAQQSQLTPVGSQLIKYHLLAESNSNVEHQSNEQHEQTQPTVELAELAPVTRSPDQKSIQPIYHAQLQPFATPNLVVRGLADPLVSISRPAIDPQSRPISSYASKLISLLRPSSLLSSIGRGEQNLSNLVTSSSSQVHHLYVLAPASASGLQMPVGLQLSRPGSSSPTATQSEILQAQGNWQVMSSHHPGSLICLHRVPAKPIQLNVIDQSSSVELPVASSDYKVTHSDKQTTGDSTKAKESPAKLAKSNSKYLASLKRSKGEKKSAISSYHAEEQQKIVDPSSELEQDFEVPMGLRKLAPPRYSSPLVSLAGRASIIPFTIEDKIETPKQQQANQPSRELSIANQPVQYDDQLDSPFSSTARPTEDPSKGVSESRNPKQGRDEKPKHRAAEKETKPSKTSFVSKMPNQQKKWRSKEESESNQAISNIDYRRESSPRESPGFYVPLLLASTRSEAEKQTTTNGHSKVKSTEAFNSVASSEGRAVRIRAPGETANLLKASTEKPGNETVELVVESTPELATTTVSSRSQMVPTQPAVSTEATTSKPQVSMSVSNHEMRAPENSAFNDHRLSSLGDNPMEDFERVSKSLETKPDDLADLQNSRSAFELPAQLESSLVAFLGSNSKEKDAKTPSHVVRSRSTRQVRF